MKIYKTISIIILLILGVLSVGTSLAHHKSVLIQNKRMSDQERQSLISAINGDKGDFNRARLENLAMAKPIAFKVFFQSENYLQHKITNDLLYAVMRNQEKIIALLSKDHKKRGGTSDVRH